MSKKSSQAAAASPSSRQFVLTLEEVDDLQQKVYRALAMASVLNVASFADSVTLPQDAFQDYTTHLAADIDEIAKMVADIRLGVAVSGTETEGG